VIERWTEQLRHARGRAERRTRAVWPTGFDLARELAHEWRTDRVGGVAAEIAFFGMLSLFPALLALTSVLGVLGSVTGQDVADRTEDQIVDYLNDVLTEQADGTVNAVSELFNQPSPGLLTVSLLLALWAASRGFAAVVRGLDIAYDLPEHRSWPRLRLVSIGLALGSVVVGAVLLAMLVIGPLLGTGRSVADDVGLGGGFAAFWDWARWPVVIALALAWATTVFHVAPNHHTRWRDDIPGAVVAAVVWILVSLGFRLYLSLAGDANQVFGVLGGVLIALVWFYLLSVGLLLGGEVNAMIEKRRPGHLRAEGGRPGTEPVDGPDHRPTP
jgi:membrane protein